MSNFSIVLAAIDAGDPQAASQLLPLVYEELRKLAAARIADERSDLTIDATALVHEAYLRLVGNQQFNNRGHFFAAAAEAMRRILIDRARAKGRLKRHGTRQQIDFRNLPLASDLPPDDLLDLESALEALTAESPAQAELVRLRFYAGLSIVEAAECLNVSRATADRYWNYARAWLFDRLRSVE